MINWNIPWHEWGFFVSIFFGILGILFLLYNFYLIFTAFVTPNSDSKTKLEDIVRYIATNSDHAWFHTQFSEFRIIRLLEDESKQSMKTFIYNYLQSIKPPDSNPYNSIAFRNDIMLEMLRSESNLVLTYSRHMSFTSAEQLYDEDFFTRGHYAFKKAHKFYEGMVDAWYKQKGIDKELTQVLDI